MTTGPASRDRTKNRRAGNRAGHTVTSVTWFARSIPYESEQAVRELMDHAEERLPALRVR